MFYRLLGDLELGERDDPLLLPTGRNLRVLAALLIYANRRMSKTELLRAAWGETPVGYPQVPKATMTIRDLLKSAGRGDDLKTHTGYGYELRIPSNELDMLSFKQHIRQAEEAAGSDAEVEIAHLRAAHRLWRGPRPLANVPAETLQAEIDQLQLRRRRAAVRLFDLEIARGGDYERLLAELEQLVSFYPDDQRLCEQLMIVQYRCGHPTDALQAYERYAERLTTELGAEPSATLKELRWAAARSDDDAFDAAIAAVVQKVGAVSTPSPSPPAVPRQLPADPAVLVGRDNLVAEAAWLLQRRPGRTCPVVVITGLGGIGKTALARRVAHLCEDHYPDGQLFMEMGATADDALDTGEILAQFLRAFDVPSIPETTGERLATLRTHLATRRVLVVLDDVASGARIRDLIPANPECGVIVTARRRLPDDFGAHHMPVLEPLDHQSATELFTQVVANAGIDLHAEREAVDTVVALCGGLPLALQIAAALRISDHPRPTSELAERLARLGPEALTYEDSSVALTISAVFDRLDPAAQRLLLGLSALRLPTFGMWTAAALLDGTAADPIATLSQLVASSLLEAAASGARYRMHDLTRDYVRRRASAELPQTAQTRAYTALLTLTRYAHAAVYRGDFEVVHSGVPDWTAPPAVLAEIDDSPLQWFERERLNIRAAVEHCADLGRPEIAWDLAVSSHEFYTLGGYFDDWYATNTIALRACRRAGDGRGEGVLLACLGQPALVASRPAAAVSGVPELERSVQLLTQSEDRHGLAIALRTLANALRRRGQLNRPLALFTEALEYYELSRDVIGCWLTLRFIGHTYLDLRRFELAVKFLRDAEAIARERDERRLLAQTWYWLGQTALSMNDLTAAQAAFAAVLDAYRTPDGVPHAYALHGLGDVARITGNFHVAEQHLVTAAELALQGQDAMLEGRVHLSFATLRQATSRREDAISALEHAVACFDDCGAIYLEAQALSSLADAYAEDGATEAAHVARVRVDDLYSEMALPPEDLVHRR